jgi:hypothetical protein
MGLERIVPTFYGSGTNRSDILSLRNESFWQRSCPFRFIIEQLFAINVARSCRGMTWYVERSRARVRGIQNVRCFPLCPEESFRQHFIGPERIVPIFYRSGTNRSDTLWVRNESFRHFIGPEQIVPAPANTLKPYLRSGTRGKTD